LNLQKYKLVQPGKSYASFTSAEIKQPITSQNNQETQKKIVSPSPEQLIISAT